MAGAFGGISGHIIYQYNFIGILYDSVYICFSLLRRHVKIWGAISEGYEEGIDLAAFGLRRVGYVTRTLPFSRTGRNIILTRIRASLSKTDLLSRG